PGEEAMRAALGIDFGGRLKVLRGRKHQHAGGLRVGEGLAGSVEIRRVLHIPAVWLDGAYFGTGVPDASSDRPAVTAIKHRSEQNAFGDAPAEETRQFLVPNVRCSARHVCRNNGLVEAGPLAGTGVPDLRAM